VSCLLPEAGQLVDARILKVNKSGAYALIVDDGRIQEAIRILIPRDLHLGNEEFDALEVDQGIKVRLLQSRFQANDTFIQAVGTYEGLSAIAQAAVTHKEKKDLLKAAVADTERALTEAREALASFSTTQSDASLEAAKKALAEYSSTGATTAAESVAAARAALAAYGTTPTPAKNAEAVAAAKAALAAFSSAGMPELATIEEVEEEPETEAGAEAEEE
jgi:hypothetical protein